MTRIDEIRRDACHLPGEREPTDVHRSSPLLISMIVLASLLAHHVHGPVARPAAPPALDAAIVAEAHHHHGVQKLQVVTHDVLDALAPELCTIGDQSPTAPSSTLGHVAALTPDGGAGGLPPATSLAPGWDPPVSPPDVLRALLQVFLN